MCSEASEYDDRYVVYRYGESQNGVRLVSSQKLQNSVAYASLPEHTMHPIVTHIRIRGAQLL